MRARLLIVLIACLPSLGAIEQAITIDYPLQDSVFPPDMAPPTFLWRDPARATSAWVIEVTFSDGSPGIHLKTPGPLLQIGEIDSRCISDTNEVPKLTPEQTGTRTWTPDTETWEQIKTQAIGTSATVTIRGVSTADPADYGRVTIQISKDPVGAPIF